MSKEDRYTEVVLLHDKLRRVSGEKMSKRVIVNFFYLLMRDKLTVGEVQTLLNEAKADVAEGTKFYFTNGFLADYAEFVVDELLENEKE